MRGDSLSQSTQMMDSAAISTPNEVKTPLEKCLAEVQRIS